MARKFSVLGTTITLLLAGASAQAAGPDDMFSLRSYGTVGVTYSGEDQADYTTSNILRPDGVGYTDSWSTQFDSRFGVQLDMSFTERLSAVVQLVAEQPFNNSWDSDPNNSFVPSLEWANVGYRLTDHVTVRVGRVVLPFYMRGESRKVGFANHWLRAPSEVYDVQLFSSSDGIDVTHRMNIGSATHSVRAYAGTTNVRTDTRQTAADLWGVTDTLEIGDWTVRGAWLHGEWVAKGPGIVLFDTFTNAARTAGTAAALAAADQAQYLQPLYNPAVRQSSESYTIGAAFDPGKWFVMSEALRKSTPGYGRSSWHGYVSGGMRLGNFTPYLTYSGQKTDRRNETRINVTGLSPQLRGMATALNNIVTGFTSVDRSRNTTSAGVRWDFGGRFALKAQYDYVNLDAGSVGDLTHIQPGFEPGSSLSIAAIAVDYVF